jgi:hypothetical protein
LAQYQQLANPVGEAWALNHLGTLHTRLGLATGQHQQAVALFREIGDRNGEASALNGLAKPTTPPAARPMPWPITPPRTRSRSTSVSSTSRPVPTPASATPSTRWAGPLEPGGTTGAR